MQNDRKITMSQAIGEATLEAMKKDDTIFVIGEGVTDPKKIFGTTSELVEKFGIDRVIESPIAENGLMGFCIGSALSGMRPLLIHQRVEFALLSMEQIINNAAKMHYISNGKHNVPVVVRLIVGRGWGQGPAHSQSLEPLFAYIPGLRVAMPAFASDAKGMMLTALSENIPTIFIEHRWCHYVTGKVDSDTSNVLLDGPSVVRSGSDITIVATSYMLYEAILASDIAKEFNIFIEIVDLRIIKPLKLEKIVESVSKTKRLICVDTGFKEYGLGAEISASIFEALFKDLLKPVKRIGLPDRPTPSSRFLAADYYPTAENILNEIGKLMDFNSHKVEQMIEMLKIKKPDINADVPNPLFKGPF